MATWRFFGEWSTDELRLAIRKAGALPVSFSEGWEEMTIERGWSQVASRSLIARERPGVPGPDDAFARAEELIEAFAHSDPRIVVAHFAPGTPLEGRVLWLELRAFGLRFLSPVRVAEVRSDQSAYQTRFGYAIDTLEGHLERGREWFLLTRNHATGELHFHIEARWREGDFPNVWSRLGFALVGRRYQRAWHRLAHLRMRRLLRETQARTPERLQLHPRPDRLERAPIQWVARRGRTRHVADLERAVEPIARTGWWALAGLAALSGARTFAPLAVLSAFAWRRHPRWLPPRLDRTLAPVALGAIALGELAADKTAWVPARTRPAALLGRAAAGALLGAALSSRWRGPRAVPSLLGAGAAVAGTFASFTARKRLGERTGWPSAAAGLLEDAAVLSGASALAARLA